MLISVRVEQYANEAAGCGVLASEAVGGFLPVPVDGVRKHGRGIGGITRLQYANEAAGNEVLPPRGLGTRRSFGFHRQPSNQGYALCK